MFTLNQHIEITADTCGGKPRIAGSRIRVQDIVLWHEQMGLSPDEIASQYSTLTLSDIYAALSYYHDNLDRIRQDIRESATTIELLRAKNPAKLCLKFRRIFHTKEFDRNSTFTNVLTNAIEVVVVVAQRCINIG